MTNYSIMDYWKDKCITSDGDIEIEIGYPGAKENLDVQNTIPVVYDWGEPCCFACGCMNWNYTEYYGNDNEIDIKKTWNQANVRRALQQAHIIPKSLGGQLTPDNMFLLCPHCHEESPDTSYPKEFFKWIYWRRHQPMQRALWYFKDAVIELSKEGVPPLINAEEVSKEITSHAWKVCASSYIAAFKGNAYKHYEAIINSVPEEIRGHVVEALRDYAASAPKRMGWTA